MTYLGPVRCPRCEAPHLCRECQAATEEYRLLLGGLDTLTLRAPWAEEPLAHMTARMTGLAAGLRFARFEAVHDALAARGYFPGRGRLRYLVPLYERAAEDLLWPFGGPPDLQDRRVRR